MAKQLQLRRGTTAQHASFTGAPGEVTVDTDKKALVVHDGATAGGVPVARAGGSATQRFKVADAVENDEAMAFSQFREITGATGDWNNYVKGGWYEGFLLLNGPPGTSWIRVFVVPHSTTTDAQQTAYDFFNDRIWVRRKVAGSWQPWVEMAKISDTGGLIDVQVFSTPGDHTWTKPAGAKYVEIYLIGGGGGGGRAAATTSTQNAIAGCGGPGAGAYSFLAASTLGATENIFVGAGGAGAAEGTTSLGGSIGQTTTFRDSAFLFASPGGGGGGGPAFSTFPLGSGDTGTTGTGGGSALTYAHRGLRGRHAVALSLNKFLILNRFGVCTAFGLSSPSTVTGLQQDVEWSQSLWGFFPTDGWGHGGGGALRMNSDSNPLGGGDGRGGVAIVKSYR